MTRTILYVSLTIRKTGAVAVLATACLVEECNKHFGQA